MKNTMWKTKQDFQGLMLDMLSPLKLYYSKEKAWLDLGNTATNYDKKAAYMETFCRPLWGLVPFFTGGGEEEWFAETYRRGIIAGTDQENAEYWGTPNEFDQRFVEMAAVAYAILMAPETFWNPLSEPEKEHIADYLYQINEHEIPRCNWYLFRVLVNLALKNTNQRFHKEKMEEALEEIESYYLGHGWYKDGVSEQKDYYISFAIHFYSMIYSKFAKEDTVRRQKIRTRAIEFGKQFIYWFDEDGAAIPYGRSLTYRFAQVSFFSACLLCEIYPFPVATLKGLIVRHLKYWMELPIYERDHILSIGYGYPNLIMSEKYNGPGSPYWCMKAFAFLALPDEHPFWKAEEGIYPDVESVCTIPEAEMIVRKYPHHHTMYVAGNYSSPGHGHSVEKYGKFAYDSKFAFSVAKSNYELHENCPDSMLAFIIDGMIYVKRICKEFEICADHIYTKWSPHPMVRVKTYIIPTEFGHVRRHIIESEIICEAYDCGFAISIDRMENSCEVSEKMGFCHAAGEGLYCSVEGEGEGVLIQAAPNTNLLYPKTVIPAIKYYIGKNKQIFTLNVITKVERRNDSYDDIKRKD